MGIERIHWGAIPPDLGPLGTPRPCFALWPEPVDHDRCFAEAGFSAFADTDDDWDADFDAFIERVLGVLSRCGEPEVLAGEPPVRPIGWFRKEEGTLRDTVACAATSDEFPPCWVGFGDPPAAHLVTSDGHPLLWIYPGTLDVGDVLAAAAGDREVARTELDWSVLVPAPHRIASARGR